MSFSARLGVALGLLSYSFERAGRAEEAKVAIVTSECASDVALELTRVSRLELVSAQNTEGSVTSEARLDCSRGVAELVVAGSKRTLRRRVELDPSHPETWPRLVGLNLGELARASALTNPSPLLVERRSEVARTSAVGAPKPPGREQFSVQVFAGAGSYGSDLGLGGSVEAGISRSIQGWLSASVDAHYGRAGRTRAFGAVRLDLASAAVRLRAHGGRVADFGIGIGAQYGVASLSGASTRAGIRTGSVRGLWGGPTLRADILWPAAAQVAAGMALDCGYAGAGVAGETGQAGERTRVGRLWLLASVGLALRF